LLVGWWAREWAGADPATHWIDEAALADLQAGELPQPFGLRILADVNRPEGEERLTAQHLAGILEHARERFPRIAGKIPAVSSRAVFFGVEVPALVGRAGVLARLRQVIPAELVEDVLVDGQSWEQSEGAPR
jgi:hypothetical protein